MEAVPIAKAADGVESSQTMRLLQEQMESLQMQFNLLRNAVHPVQSQPSKAKGAEAKCPACKGALLREGKCQVVLSCFHVVCAKCFASIQLISFFHLFDSLGLNHYTVIFQFISFFSTNSHNNTEICSGNTCHVVTIHTRSAIFWQLHLNEFLMDVRDLIAWPTWSWLQPQKIPSP